MAKAQEDMESNWKRRENMCEQKNVSEMKEDAMCPSRTEVLGGDVVAQVRSLGPTAATALVEQKQKHVLQILSRVCKPAGYATSYAT